MVGRRRWRPHFSTSGTVSAAGRKTRPSRSSREQAGSHEVSTFGKSGRNLGFISRAELLGLWWKFRESRSQRRCWSRWVSLVAGGDALFKSNYLPPVRKVRDAGRRFNSCLDVSFFGFSFRTVLLFPRKDLTATPDASCAKNVSLKLLTN